MAALIAASLQQRHIPWRELRAYLVAGLIAAPIGSLYRRAVLALSSAFATVVLMLVAVPVHQLAGQPGLIGLAALLLAGGSACALRARRAARP